MAFTCINCRKEIDPDFKLCPFCGEPVTDFLRKYEQEPIDGKYQILERLGVGGMGEVYKALHTYLNSVRVIKLMRPQISGTADAHDRFLREARVASRVQHPNVATLHDFSGLPDGAHYMVWEYIDGENLAQLIRRYGQLTPRHAVEIAIQALHGLEAIHLAGIVHRDISPENLMITHDAHGAEQVKIIDLGVAKVGADQGEASTQSGMFLGKFRYSSPEHLGFLEKGQRIDGRADLYSLAIVIYEMLAGRAPFEAKSPYEYMLLHSGSRELTPLTLPDDLPGGKELQAILMKALGRDRNSRYQTAPEFADALASLLPSLPKADEFETMITTGKRPLPEALSAPTQITTERASDAAVRPTIDPSTAPTVYTPQPVELPRTGTPTAPATAPAVPRWARPSALTLVLFAVIVIFSAAAVAVYIRSKNLPHVAAPPAVSAPSVAARKTVDVVAPPPSSTTAAAKLTAAPATTTTEAEAAPTRSKPAPVSRAKARPDEEPPSTADSASDSGSAHTWTEGGDSDKNERALSEARRQLHGASRVAVRGSGDADLTKDLMDVIRRNIHSVTVVEASEHPDATIDFNGKIERLGFGRKRRSAEAIVRRGGRAVFRYEMPAQDYRVGDTPAEAFGRILSDLLNP